MVISWCAYTKYSFQFVFVLTDLAMGVGYVRVICDLPQPEAALYPGLLTLFVCIISGANAVDIFFRDYNCYRWRCCSFGQMI